MAKKKTDNKNSTTTPGQDAAQPAERNKAAEQSTDRGWNHKNSCDCLARLGVVHPVENDLRRPVPTGHHVARHLSVGAAGQTKVQDLQRERRGREGGRSVTVTGRTSPDKTNRLKGWRHSSRV